MQLKPYAIFDMDGTLLNSTGMWDEVAHELLGRWGKKFTRAERSDSLTMTIEGTAKYFVQHYSLPIAPTELATLIREGAERGYTSTAALKPGAETMLKELQACGVKMCVASGTEKPLIDIALRHFGISDYFEFTISCLDELDKSDPEVYLRAMGMLGAPAPGEVMVFEDSPTAVHTAKQAGFYTVGILDEFTADSAAQVTAEADAVVQSWPAFTAAL